MTFKEAKKILKKEGYELEKVGRPFIPSIAFTAYESPEICEAMQVACSAGYSISMVSSRFIERKACLKKEYEKNTKAPGPGEEQLEEKKRIICCNASPKADFYYKHVLNEGNPALKESASQFNDALLDEHAKKIAELTKEKTNLEDRITILNAFKEHNENVGRKQIKRLGKEIAMLNGIIHGKNEVIADLGKELKVQKGLANHISGKYDGAKINLKLRMDECENWKKKLEEKDAVLSDVAEELRLSKIREKNLTEVCQKYMKENEELKGKLLYVKKYRVSSDNAEEGADLSGVFVLCGKDFIDALKNVKDVWQE